MQGFMQGFMQRKDFPKELQLFTLNGLCGHVIRTMTRTQGILCRVSSPIFASYIYVGAWYSDMGGVLSSRLIGNFERGCCQIIIQLFLGFCREGVFSLHPSKKVLSSCVIKVFQIIIQLFWGFYFFIFWIVYF